MGSNSSNRYPIRRESLISPWGIGAIVPFPHDESLMVAGLDYWFDEDHPKEDFLVVDERLSKRLAGKQLVLPPDYREYKQDRVHANMYIPAVRFPLWHYCPVCGNMEKIGSAGKRMKCSGEIRKSSGKETYCSKNKSKQRELPYMIPERFVAVCEDGHIEDFPIEYWVHKKSGYSYNPSTCKLIRSTGGSSSSLAGIRYTCTCGASATMTGAFFKDSLTNIGYTCSGNEPWLGEHERCSCGKPLRVLQRGASNVWYQDTISSVYIPWLPQYKNQETKDCIAKGVRRFSSSVTNGEIDVEKITKFVNLIKTVDDKIDVEQCIKEIVDTLKNSSSDVEELHTDDEYKKQEFDVLTRSVGETKDELFVRNNPSSQYHDLSFIKSISLVHKLRETKVFLGFKRLSATNKCARISLNCTDWYPAVKNSGEGIMFEFDYSLINNWASQADVKKRISIIDNNLNSNGKLAGRHINPAYVLIHTFSHCLITALSNHSGYSNASVREKIYCNMYLSDRPQQMAGVLIYTASGDSEGSLGGLVRQGLPGRIEPIIKMAINEARWCAADPVCIQSSGQGQEGCNLAACHNCALLPETSCENNNKLLDRGVLIGTLENEKLGFFNQFSAFREGAFSVKI